MSNNSEPKRSYIDEDKEETKTIMKHVHHPDWHHCMARVEMCQFCRTYEFVCSLGRTSVGDRICIDCYYRNKK